FACPLTAGVAALIRCANPGLTPLQVQQAIKQTANNTATPNNLYGWGIVNADSALKYVGMTTLGLGSISGKAFNDVNGNGIMDAGEPPLSGIRIRISGVVTDSTLTDGSGNFTFSNLPIDTYYLLSQQTQNGWYSTTGSRRILLIHPSDTTAINFGSFQNGIISGHLYNDVNRNGIFDAGDSVLAHWTVRLSGSATQSVLTDSTGWYAFPNLSAGTYTVSESTQVNWAQSFPPDNGFYSVTMRSGLDTTTLVFLNYYDAQFNYPVAGGWNLLSLPQIPASHLKTDIYPSAKSQAFIYNHAYKTIDTIPNGIGYWLKFANSQNILILGTERTADTVSVVTGWNMIGSLSGPFAVSSIGQNPTGNVSSNYFQYNGAYSVADSLRPHTGYWVKAKNPGQLYVNSSGGHALPLAAQTTNPAQLNQITFIDAGKRQQTLYFTQDPSLNNERDRYELPPLPPDGGFDVRFANGS
ncbi:MAG TPA: SdrD B-like domain-containing protein, partial [Bacteroidota bacterium]|nr:SdrD B-like domain-containing protein [Bacteroidota bacterium]